MSRGVLTIVLALVALVGVGLVNTLVKLLPTGLEPRARHLIFETVARLHEEGHTVLLVEQNARAGLATADYGAVLDGGRVAIAGHGSELLADPRLGELYLGGSAAVEAGSTRR